MATISTKCTNPSCENEGKHLCKGCVEARYCSADCQREHWSRHKLSCKLAHKPEAVALQQSFKDMSVQQLRNILKAKMRDITETKRKALQSSLDNALEKPTLLKLVQDNVDPSEIDTLLSKPSSTPAPSSSSGNGSSSSVAGRGSKSNRSTGYSAQTANGNAMPTPEIMRKMAQEFRKNPNLMRQKNPAMANYTDAQIIAQVEMMEKAANDPKMLATMVKNQNLMQKMSQKQQGNLAVLQEYMQGSLPSGDTETNVAATMIRPMAGGAEHPKLMQVGFKIEGNYKAIGRWHQAKIARVHTDGTYDVEYLPDDRWIDAGIDVVRNNPDIFKQLIGLREPMEGGLTEDHLKSMIDWVSKMDPGVLRFVIKSAQWLMRAYKAVDTATYGNAKYLAMLLMGLLVYLLYRVLAFGARLVYLAIVWIWRLATGGSAAAAAGSSGAKAAPEVAKIVQDTAAAAAKVAAPTATAASAAAGVAGKAASTKMDSEF